MSESPDFPLKNIDSDARSPAPHGDSAGTTDAKINAPDDTKVFIDLATKIVAPTSALTALLFYFGWVRARASLRVYGLPDTIVNYNLTDYLMRSVSAMYVPLGVIAIAVGLLTLLNAKTSRLTSPFSRQRVANWSGHAQLIGIALFIYGVVALFSPRVAGNQRFVTPMALLSGVVLFGVATRLRYEVDRRSHGSHPSAALIAAYGALVLLAAFYATADYANYIGDRRATSFMNAIGNLPEASVLSNYQLQIGAPGVSEAALGSDKGYRYRYTGLRFLMRTESHYVFIHPGWKRESGTTILVPVADIGRIDFIDR